MKEIEVIGKKIDRDYYESHFDELVNKVYPARREAVLRLKNKNAAIMSLATGLTLQEIIYQECNISPTDLIIEKNENGKPYVVGCPDFYFNLSHSSDMLVMAYGNTKVGIDIEKVSDKDLNIAKRCFTEEENDYITSEEYVFLENGESISKEGRFYTIWTMKEAYLKYKGTGISVPLNSFQVNPLEKTVFGEEVKIYTKLFQEYVISLCVSSEENVKIVSEKLDC